MLRTERPRLAPNTEAPCGLAWRWNCAATGAPDSLRAVRSSSRVGSTSPVILSPAPASSPVMLTRLRTSVPETTSPAAVRIWPTLAAAARAPPASPAMYWVPETGWPAPGSLPVTCAPRPMRRPVTFCPPWVGDSATLAAYSRRPCRGGRLGGVAGALPRPRWLSSARRARACSRQEASRPPQSQAAEAGAATAGCGGAAALAGVAADIPARAAAWVVASCKPCLPLTVCRRLSIDISRPARLGGADAASAAADVADTAGDAGVGERAATLARGAAPTSAASR